jgi:predicted amidohydrolase YtcJ
LRACGYTKDTPNPPGGEIQRDQSGNPTGLLIARPNATILYATLAKGPKLPPEHQLNSTRHFMRELNRLGLTSIIDAGGGFQNYPEDYAIIEELHKRGEMTLRIAYNLFTQKPKQEKEDFARWIKMTGPGKGDDFFRCNGAGEMLVFSAADFEDFLEPRPICRHRWKRTEGVVSLLAANKWPFRLHATYDESITRFPECVRGSEPRRAVQGLELVLRSLRDDFDRNLERVKALGGGIAIQHRMAYQGEYFMDRYGKKGANERRPSRRCWNWHSGRRGHGRTAWRATIRGFALLAGDGQNRRRCLDVSRKTCSARGSAAALHPGQQLVFKRERKEGAIRAGQLADLLRSRTIISPCRRKDQSDRICSHVVGGQIVHATENSFARAAADSGAAGMVAHQEASAATERHWIIAKAAEPVFP